MKLQAGRRSFGPGDERVKLVARHGAAVVDRLVAAAAEPRAAVAGDGSIDRQSAGQGTGISAGGVNGRAWLPVQRTTETAVGSRPRYKPVPPSGTPQYVQKLRMKQTAGATQSADETQVALHGSAVPGRARVEIAAIGVGDACGRDAPAPSVTGGAGTASGGRVQGAARHGRAGSEGARQGARPAGTGTGVAQQTPCAQNPLRHSSSEVQVAGSLKPHRPTGLHGWPVTQSSFVAQIDLQTPRATSHANGAQMKPCAPHGWSSGRTSALSPSVRSDGASPFAGASLPATSAGPSALARSAGPSPVFGWSTGASAGGASPVSLASLVPRSWSASVDASVGVSTPASSGSRAASLTDGAPVGSPPASAERAATGERRQPAAVTAIAATAKAARRAARLPIAPRVH